MHKPVLLKEVLDLLNLKKGNAVFDATINRGGHTKEFCKLIGKDGTLIGADLDQNALNEAGEKLKNEKCRVFLKKGSFRDLNKILEKIGIKKMDAFLFDLGFSSEQLDESKRGFSFKKNEPLLMTFKNNPNEEDLTAREIINEWEEKNIADIIYGYGEEKFSRTIAKKIAETRKEKPIEMTLDLVSVIEKAVPNWYKHKKIHFATKTFQALRIAVNDEINSLKEALPKAVNALKKGGRIAIISFHSIEDRVVKRFFNNQKDADAGIVITKKPITPSVEEIADNPRARSAKLRIFEKL